MAFAIEIESSFVVDVDGTRVVGRCLILSAAERLAYSSAYAQLQDSAPDDIESVVRLVDQWVAKTLVECDATVGGKTYSECDEPTRALYVGHMPMAVKEAIMKTALGITSLEDRESGNSESGPTKG